MIMHTILAARKIFQDHEIIVSTDDAEIKKHVEGEGLEVPFLRPPHLASDTAGIYEVLLHSLEYTRKNGLDPNVIVLLQPTSPFRSADHIREALNIYEMEKGLDMIVSVTETKANPYYVLFEENRKGFLEHSKKGNFERRQDCPKVWQYNGAIYIINVASIENAKLSEFKKIRKYVMDEESSHDIDTPTDWMLAEKMLENRSRKP